MDGGLDGKLFCSRDIWFGGYLFVWGKPSGYLIMTRVMQLSSACYASVSLDHNTNSWALHISLPTHPSTLSLQDIPIYPMNHTKFSRKLLSAAIPAYTLSVPLNPSLFHKLLNLPFLVSFSSNTRSLGSCISIFASTCTPMSSA
jgi:hypothetical protein